MSSGEIEHNKSQFDNEKYFDEMVGHVAGMHEAVTIDEKKRSLIIFSLGRCYMLCQLLGLNRLGPFNKSDFRQLAEELGAKID